MTGAPFTRALIPNYNLRGAIEHAKAAGVPVTMPVSPTTTSTTTSTGAALLSMANGCPDPLYCGYTDPTLVDERPL